MKTVEMHECEFSSNHPQDAALAPRQDKPPLKAAGKKPEAQSPFFIQLPAFILQLINHGTQMNHDVNDVNISCQGPKSGLKMMDNVTGR